VAYFSKHLFKKLEAFKDGFFIGFSDTIPQNF
jgi:hypothetical protein